MESRISDNKSVIGIILVALGALSLLQNFGMLGFMAELMWALLFAAGGATFAYLLLRNRENWWAAIPAGALFGIAATIGASSLPWIPGGIVGAMFMTMLSLSFAVVYVMDRTRWWAIIPGGVLLSVAATAALSEFLPGEAAGGVLFLGMAATFLSLTILPGAPNLRWGFIPAAVLGVMGALLMMSAVQLAGIIWPLALIALGIGLIYRNRNREIYR